jgi:hypothetical protein
MPGKFSLVVFSDIEELTEDYLLFLAGLSSLGKPYLAMSAFALSTFLITKGDLLTSDRLGSTVTPGKCFPVVVLDI